MNSVLIVDDEEDLSAMLGLRLRSHGWQVEYANNGAAALQQIAVVRPDVVLLDVVMPAMDGWEVGRRLRADAGTAALPIIYMTARQSHDVAQHSAAVGAAAVFVKPFAADALLAALQRCVSS